MKTGNGADGAQGPELADPVFSHSLGLLEMTSSLALFGGATPWLVSVDGTWTPTDMSTAGVPAEPGTRTPSCLLSPHRPRPALDPALCSQGIPSMSTGVGSKGRKETGLEEGRMQGRGGSPGGLPRRGDRAQPAEREEHGEGLRKTEGKVGPRVKPRRPAEPYLAPRGRSAERQTRQGCWPCICRGRCH